MGLPHAWNRMELFYQQLEPKGVIAARRRQQLLDWLGESLQEGLRKRFYQNLGVRAKMPAVRDAVLRGELTVAAATQTLLAAETKSPHYDSKN